MAVRVDRGIPESALHKINQPKKSKAGTFVPALLVVGIRSANP
jgi:hypothetical protein